MLWLQRMNFAGPSKTLPQDHQGDCSGFGKCLWVQELGGIDGHSDVMMNPRNRQQHLDFFQ